MAKSKVWRVFKLHEKPYYTISRTKPKVKGRVFRIKTKR